MEKACPFSLFKMRKTIDKIHLKFILPRSFQKFFEKPFLCKVTFDTFVKKVADLVIARNAVMNLLML